MHCIINEQLSKSEMEQQEVQYKEILVLLLLLLKPFVLGLQTETLTFKGDFV